MQSARGDAIDIDLMYIGDGSDNSLKVFTIKKDTVTASFTGTVVKSQGGLHGPHGLLIDAGGNLLVSDQNVGTSANGDISLYDSATGKLLNRVVSHDEPIAPTVPRGIVTFTLSRTDIFVADYTAEPQSKRPPTPGRVRAYTAVGGFIGDLTPDDPLVPLNRYHPRAVVIGPDGLLYVSNAPNGDAGLGGDVLRFNPSTGAFIDVFVHDTGGAGQLNRPEGICFGPDGKLYLTSFADLTPGAGDNDKIRIYQGPGGTTPGAFVDAIDLDVAADVAGGQRAFAQALVFGPGGRLFVPITGSGPNYTGSVRSYDVAMKTFQTIVSPAVSGGPLGQPLYLTFGKTNPSTLNYGP
jgi:sugar lactone lactonase YvrE